MPRDPKKSSPGEPPSTLASGARDRRILYAAAFLRSMATGMGGVLLGVYLAKRGLDASEIGGIISVGLSGVALAALFVTLLGDRLGRRRSLVWLAVLGATGGLGVSALDGLLAFGMAAFVGMVNGMGRDRGAAVIIDHAILPSTASDSGRTTAFAWYSVVQDAGHALGSLLAATPVLLQRLLGLTELPAFRVAFVVYSAALLSTAFLYARLSDAVDGSRSHARRVEVSPETRRVLWKLASLFAIDSLGGGFLTTALLAYFFFEQFGVGEATVGALFFLARVANAVSHLGAAWLARRIGLVNTMVFTHLPSSVLLMTVPFAPNFPVAALLFLLREGLVEMDVPTRQSYLMAVVEPEERTVASGVTQLARLGAWAVAPAFAGLMMRGLSLGAPLLVGAGMKITYDLLLFAAFKEHKPPEERSTET